MKISGKTNRAEPSDMSWVQTFPNCARSFLEAGWLSFFEKMMGITQRSLISLLSAWIKILLLLTP